MNLEFLSNFIQTANDKSIAKASEALNLTHPALSKQIRKLEAYYGVTLFYRSASGVDLTEAGKMLYERLSGVLGELASIRSEMSPFRTDAGHTELKVGTLPSLAAYYLPSRIVAMEQEGFHIQLTVKNTSERLLAAVSDGELDAAVIDYNQTSHFLWGKELFREPFCVIVPDNHPFLTKDSVSINDIAAEPLVMYPRTCSIRKSLIAAFKNRGIKSARIKTEIPFGDHIPGYVAAGAGIAVVPQMTADHLGHPKLKVIPIAEREACRTITLVAATETIGKQLYTHIKK